MPTLDEQFLQTINQQRDYLAKLQETFDKQCDEITAKAKVKLATIPAENVEDKNKIVQEQKIELDQALETFKNEVTHSNSVTRKKLEDIHSQREAAVLLQLEEEMKNS